MSIGIIAVALVLLVIGAIVWARVASARSTTRSVDTYEHALDVLGEVSKRTEPTGFRILPHEETGQPHVRTSGRDSHQAPVTPPAPSSGRPRITPPPPAGRPQFSVEASPRAMDQSPTDQVTSPVPAFIDDSLPPHELEDAEPPGATDDAPDGPNGEADATSASASQEPNGPAPARRRAAHRRTEADLARQQNVRRVATGGAAAVALVAVVAAALLMAGGSPANKTTTTTTKPSHTTTTTATTTTQPSALLPIVDASGNVSYAVAGATYTVVFRVTGGVSYLAVQQVSGGPYVWQNTIGDGSSASYDATGPIIVTLGAPAYVAMQVNGVQVKPPVDTPPPSVVSFVPTASTGGTTTTVPVTTTTLPTTTSSLG